MLNEQSRASAVGGRRRALSARGGWAALWLPNGVLLAAVLAVGWLACLPHAVPAPAAATTPATAPATAPATTRLVIRGATILDATVPASHDGGAIPDGVVVVVGDRIRYVGVGASPPSTGRTRDRVIDGRGLFLLPGLADLHHHLGTGSVTGGDEERLVNLAAMLHWGFTSVFEPGSTRQDFLAVRDAVRRQSARYPRYWGAGPYLGAPEGWGTLQGGIAIASAAEAVAAVAALQQLGVDGVKIVYDDMSWLRSEAFPMLSPEVLRAAIEAAHARGLRAFIHAPILEHARTAVAAGADALVHGVLTAPIDDQLLAQMQARGVGYVATLSMYEATGDLAGWVERQRPLLAGDPAALARARDLVSPGHLRGWQRYWDRSGEVAALRPTARDNLRRAYQAGVLVATGTDTGVPGVLLGASSQLELVLHAEAGLPGDAVLRAATRNAALLMGAGADSGTLEVGKVADLLLVAGDPRQDWSRLRAVRCVIRAGRPLPGCPG